MILIILAILLVVVIAALGIARNAIAYVGTAVILLAAIVIFILAGGTNAKF